MLIPNTQKNERDFVMNRVLEELLKEIESQDLDAKIESINLIRQKVHEISPFKNEPVDFVKWVKVDNVVANDYNPNSVAPPEMELLRHSINNDGYTQPVVAWENKEKTEVVDGFHRTRVCKEFKDVHDRVHGYLPIVGINDTCSSRNDRMASTVRHNRARGKHNVTAMSDMVKELKNRNWKNSRIAKELGMDEDEVLRLCQITGLENLFEDRDFSKAWEAKDAIIEDTFQPLTDDLDSEENKGRTANTNDPDRIFHTFDKWECVNHNFYGTKKEGMTKEQCQYAFAEFLSDQEKFSSALSNVINEWKYSCEHYLTNKAMNRIAWLGQAAVAYELGIPSVFCSGWQLMSDESQKKANETALEYLNIWLLKNNREKLTMEEALSVGRQVEIY
jgi:ParB-like chromosome segregation protein Spo0J